jgi:Glycosyltransferase family 87
MTSTNRQRVLLAGAVIVLVAGLLANWSAGRGGVDFPSLYVIGRGFLTGTNIYAPGVTDVFPSKYGVAQPMGMFYPPATGFIMLPFAVFPYGIAKLAWLLVIDLTLAFGIRSLVRFAAPQARTHVWVFCLGIVLLSSALRWGMILLQGAPLVLGLLCLFIVSVHGNRPYLSAAIAALAVAVKMTLSLPFLGILLLRRRFGAAFAGVATWIALNAIGFSRMGPGAFRQYRGNVALLESFGNINAPDPWNPLSLPRLDWTSLLFGLSGNLAASRVASLALTALVSIWLLRKGLRVAEPTSLRSTTLFLAPLVCLGSLCVYHHHYDACLFFAPALLSYLVWGRRARPHWAVLLMLPLLAMMLVLPIGVVQGLAQAALGMRGVGLLKISFPIASTLALVGSLFILGAAEQGDAAAATPALDELGK